MAYVFYTEVSWGYWDDKEFVTRKESNIITANSYAQTAGMIEENYGEELLSIDKMEILNDSSYVAVSIEAGRAFAKAVDRYGMPDEKSEDDSTYAQNWEGVAP